MYNPSEEYEDTSSDETEDTATGQSEYTDDLWENGVTDEEAEATTPNQYKVTVDSDND